VLEAQRGFRKLRGYKGMPALLEALREHAERINPIDQRQEVA
jgi:hypothetical protein